MAEPPPRSSAIEAAREADWLPRPRKDIGYLIDAPVRGDERTQDQRYRPARYDARLQHALDGVIRLWGKCYFCGRVRPVNPAGMPPRYRPRPR